MPRQSHNLPTDSCLVYKGASPPWRRSSSLEVAGEPRAAPTASPRLVRTDRRLRHPSPKIGRQFANGRPITGAPYKVRGAFQIGDPERLLGRPGRPGRPLHQGALVTAEHGAEVHRPRHRHLVRRLASWNYRRLYRQATHIRICPIWEYLPNCWPE